MSDGMGREFTYLSSHATNRYFIPNWGNNSSFFSVGQNYFVMNRETGKIIELDHGMFDKIQQSQFNDMQYDDLRILYRNGILV